jgi:molybdate transport system ATP-binding protein
MRCGMLEADLHKQLRDFSIDLNIKVNPGEIMVLMGENGAGKSTVLNMVAGLVTPGTGSVRLDGRDLYRSAAGVCVPVESRHIGYVLQRSAVFPHLTVSENVAYGMKARHMEKDLIPEQTERWMHLMDIKNLANVRAGNLSGGQKQRVALARAFAIRPALLMLDEPFTALDAKSTTSIKDSIRKCVAELEIPCITVMHHVIDAHDVGDRICILRQGKNVWEGKSCDLPVSGYNADSP